MRIRPIRANDLKNNKLQNYTMYILAKREEANEREKSRFLNGLHQWLRDIAGCKFYRIEEFDGLRRIV